MSRLWIRIFRRSCVMVLGMRSWLYNEIPNAQIIAVAYLFGCLAYLFLRRMPMGALCILVLYGRARKSRGGYSEEMNVTLGIRRSVHDHYATALCGILASDLLYTTRKNRTSGNGVGSKWPASSVFETRYFQLAFFPRSALEPASEKFFSIADRQRLGVVDRLNTSGHYCF